MGLEEMRTTEILDLLRANPDSYIERTLGVYCIKGANGVRLVDFEPVHQQIDDLLYQSRIKQAENNRYVLSG